jgi:hypothetical protein
MRMRNQTTDTLTLSQLGITLAPGAEAEIEDGYCVRRQPSQAMADRTPLPSVVDDLAGGPGRIVPATPEAQAFYDAHDSMSLPCFVAAQEARKLAAIGERAEVAKFR